MTLEGAFASVGNRQSWPVTQFEAVLTQRKEVGQPELQTLGVSLARGMTKREADDGRPAASLDQTNYKVVHPGDIIMNALGKPHGSIGVSSELGITSPAYWVLNVDPRLGEPRFFHYLLRSDHAINEYKRLGKYLPPNQFDLSWELFRDIEFPLPPIDEQRRIADFLDDQVGRIDQAIELRRGQRKLIEQQIRSLITKMVTGGEGDESGDPRRTPAMTGRKVAYLPLRHIADVRSSNVDKKTDPEGVPVRLVNYTDVYYQTDITPSLDLMHATATREQLERFRVMPGDSIITKDSETPQDIAVSAYVSETDSEMVCGYHLSILRPGPVVDPKFFYWALTSEFVREQFSAKANGMTRFGLGIDSIRSTTFPVPTIEEQRRIADFLDDQVARRHDAMAHLATSIASFEERKRSLITAVVTGQLDVTAARPVGVGS